MKFWIVTPSYNSLAWLKRCLPSVCDQAGKAVHVHHHVQDAASADGTQEYLKDYAERIAKDSSLNGIYSFSYTSEKDNGMYDAINRGWDKAGDDVDILAHLNCDEQYLSDALVKVAAYFERHTDNDVVFADMVVVDKNGGYICHRRALSPYALTSRFCCAGFTATTFQRRDVFKKKNIRFDTRWRNFGDKVWYNALHKAGCRFGILHEMTSVFTDTGANMNWTEEGLLEQQRYKKEFLHGMGFGVSLVVKLSAPRRWLLEQWLTPPKTYSLFWDSDTKRDMRSIQSPTGFWHKRFPTKDLTAKDFNRKGRKGFARDAKKV